MRRITLRERGRIFTARPGAEVPDGTPDARWLDERLFERLAEHDTRRKHGAVFTWLRGEARAGQWVGVLQLPGLVVELLPKIEGEGEPGTDAVSLARDNLLAMLAEAGDVPLRTRDLAALSTRKAPLHEALVALFARRLLSELLRGPDRAYVAETDDLRTLRGKLLVGQHAARNAARRERFTCAFEEYSPDTPLSRVFRATCRALLGLTSADPTREALAHCLLVLQDVGDLGDPLPWLERVTLTRQNERFAELLGFCRLVLEQLAPTARAGRASTFSLLFDMDRVFEGFVAGFLRRRVLVDLPDARVLPQARGRRDYLLRTEDGRDALRLKPDLLVEAPGARLVIDTKWKRLGEHSQERHAGVSAGDLYQLAAYTRRFGVARSVLLFPRTAGATERAFQLLGKDGEPEGGEVRVRFVDLHRNLRREDERAALAGELRALLVENLVAA